MSVAKHRAAGMSAVQAKTAKERMESVLIGDNLINSMAEGKLGNLDAQGNDLDPVHSFRVGTPLLQAFNGFKTMQAAIASGVTPNVAMKNMQGAIKRELDGYIESGGTPEEFAADMTKLSDKISNFHQVPIDNTSGALSARDIMNNAVGSVIRDDFSKFSKFSKPYIAEQVKAIIEQKIRTPSEAEVAAEAAMEMHRAMGAGLDTRPSYGVRMFGQLQFPARTFAEAADAYQTGAFVPNDLFWVEMKRRGLNLQKNGRSSTLLGTGIEKAGRTATQAVRSSAPFLPPR